MRAAAKSLLLAAFFSTGIVQGAGRAAPKVIVAIQPLGPVHPVILQEAETGILSLYDVDVKILPPRELPAGAYYKPRARYRAEKLLEFLLGLPHGGCCGKHPNRGPGNGRSVFHVPRETGRTGQGARTKSWTVTLRKRVRRVKF